MAAIAASSCGVMVLWPDDDVLPYYLNSSGMCLEQRSHSGSHEASLASALVLDFAMPYPVKE